MFKQQYLTTFVPGMLYRPNIALIIFIHRKYTIGSKQKKKKKKRKLN